MCGTGDRCYAGPGKKQKIERKNFQGRVPKELSVRYRLFSEKMANKHLYPDFGFLEKNM